MGKKNKNKIHSLSRRDFLKYVSGTAASVAILGACDDSSTQPDSPSPEEETALAPRTRASNVFVNSAGKPLLVCVTGTDFAAMLAAGLAKLGGLSKLISDRQDVLIKPNCNAAEPYPGASDVNSIVSIIQDVKKVTTGMVTVADQGYEAAATVYPFTEMDPKVKQAGAELLEPKQTYSVRRNGWSLNILDFKVYKEIYDAPIIINACNLKRHHTADFTCALKNNVGTVAGPALASTRYWLHREANDFATGVAEMAGVINPELNIVDARTVLTVSGPSYHSGVLVAANKIVLSGDIVATDAYCAKLLADHDPQFEGGVGEEIIRHAKSIGMGTSDLSEVEIHEITA
jgi:uncharacterized protein (DUF362 family)